MKSILFLIVLILLNAQVINAQLNARQNQDLSFIEKETSVKLFPKAARDVVYINSELQIDLIKLCNKKGDVVFQATPEKNHITLSKEIKKGFYMYIAYVNGVKVKKGIIKKV